MNFFTDPLKGTHALYSFDECRALDQESVEKGIPEQQLMGQAALASLYQILCGHENRLNNPDGIVCILCGPGNNGGDGYALAWHMLGSNIPDIRKRLRIYSVKKAKNPSSVFYERLLTGENISILPADHFSSSVLSGNDIIIEALLGTGQNKKPEGIVDSLLKQIAASRKNAKAPLLISLDVPAGLGEWGSIYKNDTEYSIPDEIHSYGVEKICTKIHPEICLHSRTLILPVGFTPDHEEKNVFAFRKHADFKNRLRSDLSHKYTAGHGFLFAGSSGMEGAFILSARSFFASGGGILNGFLPENTDKGMLLNLMPGILYSGIDAINAADKIPSAAAIGPGLTFEDLNKFSDKLLVFLNQMSAVKNPPWIILDAAACSLVLDEDYPASLKKRTILTPHTGEWKKMGGKAVWSTNDLFDEINRIKSSGANILIKDAFSIFYDAISRRLHLDCSPEASLSVAGSGDVLPGILLAFFSRKTDETPSETVNDALILHRSAGKKNFHSTSEEIAMSIRSAMSNEKGITQ